MDDASRCTARSSRSGERCKKAKAHDAEVCATHGASAPQVKAAAKRRRDQAEAAKAVESLSIPVETTPEDALLAEVRHVAGDVAFLRQQVRHLGEDLTQFVATSEFGGHDAPSVWVEMYWQAHDRLVRVAAATIKAGVEERKVRVAEREMDAVAEAIHATLKDIGVEVTPEVGRSLGRHLRAVV